MASKQAHNILLSLVLSGIVNAAEVKGINNNKISSLQYDGVPDAVEIAGPEILPTPQTPEKSGSVAQPTKEIRQISKAASAAPVAHVQNTGTRDSTIVDTIKKYETTDAEIAEAKAFVDNLNIDQLHVSPEEILPPVIPSVQSSQVIDNTVTKARKDTVYSNASLKALPSSITNTQTDALQPLAVETATEASMDKPTELPAVAPAVMASAEMQKEKGSEEKVEVATETATAAVPTAVSSAETQEGKVSEVKVAAEPKVKKAKKSGKRISQKQSKAIIKASRAEQDRKLGTMLRQFFSMLGFVPKDEHMSVSEYMKQTNNIRAGWYFGGLLGATINQTRLMVTEGLLSSTQYTFKNRFENTLPTFGIQFGKQFVHGKLLTDISAFFMGTFTNNKVSIDNPAESTKYENNLKEKYRAGVAVALGTPIAENMAVFGKVGVAYSSYQFHYTEPASRGNFGKKMFGIAPGLMVKYHPTDKFSLSLDVSYMQSLGKMRSGNISSESGFNYKANLRPQALTVMLGFNRMF